MPSNEQVAYHEASHAVLIHRFGGAFTQIEIGEPKLIERKGKQFIVRGCVETSVDVADNRRHIVVLAGVVGMLHLNFPWDPGRSDDAAYVDALVKRVASRFTPEECGSDLFKYAALTGSEEPTRAHLTETAGFIAADWPSIRKLADELVRTELATMSSEKAVALISP